MTVTIDGWGNLKLETGGEWVGTLDSLLELISGAMSELPTKEEDKDACKQ